MLLIINLFGYGTHAPPTRRIIDVCLLHAPVSIGEFIDKVTILEIKLERLTDPKKMNNIRKELYELTTVLELNITLTPELCQLKNELRHINEQLWEIEDDIRAKEAASCFDEQFITLARAVYFTNDKRSIIKRKINKLSGSTLIEEKEYTKYPVAATLE